MATSALARRRKMTNRVVVGLCLAATAIGLFMLALILYTLILRGFGGLSLDVFTHMTRAPGSARSGRSRA